MKEDEKDLRTVWRVRYGKNILETGTNVTIAGYRYSTRGFHTLSEVWIATLMTATTLRARCATVPI